MTGTAADPPQGRVERQERMPASEHVDEVAPGILRIQIPIHLPGLGHVNCYVLEDDRGVTLVDPGLPDPGSNADLVSKLASAGIPAERIHTVLVTHSHPDHFGGAGRLRVEHHCEVVAHEDFTTPFDPQPVDLELVELETGSPGAAGATDGPTFDLGEQVEVEGVDGPINQRLASVLFGTGPLPDIPARPTPYGEPGFRPGEGELEFMRSWDDMTKKGLLQLSPTSRVADSEWLTIGGRQWQALHTPGHTGDHLCLYDPEAGVMLSGDHVLPTITPHISGLTPSSDALADFFQALNRVAELAGTCTVLPAHGLPFTDLPGRVAEIIEHHDERLARIMDIGAAIGTAGVLPYSRELFEERNWGPMAESETYAHLEHLRLLGRMQVGTSDEGKLIYTPVPE
jgi:glyoxylase-like metal-dependent hydrolase (beta-lactamase superfamily II)